MDPRFVRDRIMGVNGEAPARQPPTRSPSRHEASVRVAACADAGCALPLLVSLSSSSDAVVRDLTTIPSAMDAQLERLDPDGALRPSIINVGKLWTKRSQKKLLEPLQTSSLDVAAQKLEKNTCYDLLDALTKSGSTAFAVEDANLHVVIASTHCFEKSIMNTLVRDNVNPIAKVEHSQLIVASNIFGVPPSEMLTPEAAERIKHQSSDLFEEVKHKSQEYIDL